MISKRHALLLAICIIVPLTLVGCSGGGQPASLTGQITLNDQPYTETVRIEIVDHSADEFTGGKYEFTGLTSDYITLIAVIDLGNEWYRIEEYWKLHEGANKHNLEFSDNHLETKN